MSNRMDEIWVPSMFSRDTLIASGMRDALMGLWEIIRGKQEVQEGCFAYLLSLPRPACMLLQE